MPIRSFSSSNDTSRSGRSTRATSSAAPAARGAALEALLTAKDPSLAPAGHSSIYVLVPVPNRTAKIDWAKEKAAFREGVLAAMPSGDVIALALRGLVITNGTTGGVDVIIDKKYDVIEDYE